MRTSVTSGSCHCFTVRSTNQINVATPFRHTSRAQVHCWVSYSWTVVIRRSTTASKAGSNWSELDADAAESCPTNEPPMRIASSFEVLTTFIPPQSLYKLRLELEVIELQTEHLPSTQRQRAETQRAWEERGSRAAPNSQTRILPSQASALDWVSQQWKCANF